MEERGLTSWQIYQLKRRGFVDFPAGVFVPEDSSAARERAAGIR